MIRFRAEKSFSRYGYDLWVMDDRRDGFYIAKPIKLEFEKHDEATLLPEPTWSVDEFMAKDLIPELRKTLAGFNWMNDKEDYDQLSRVQKLMQAHIDSLKSVVDKVVK